MPATPGAEFSAPYDRSAKIISAAICASTVVLSVVPHTLIVAIFMALLLVLLYGFSVQGYMCTRRSVIVKRPFGNTEFSLRGLSEARPADPGDFRGAIHLFGSGGLFGYYGLFRTSRLGKCTWYVNDRSKAVVLITYTKTALFGPGDVDGFLAAVLRDAPAKVRTSPRPISEQQGGSPSWIAISTAAVIALAAALATGALFYSPGPPGYRLTPQALTILDRFYPVTIAADTVDISGIRVVDVDTDRQWLPASRIDGFGNLRYSSGWFRLANGKKVRMYRARGRRLVLLPPKDDAPAVLYQARDPVDLVREIRREWQVAP